MTKALTEPGVVDSEVTVRRVSKIERHADTDKIRRFIPLRPAATG